MTRIDLNEIPDGETFELSCAGFLGAIGFRILDRPARGADEGMDLLVSESLGGVVSRARRRWLVSVKHHRKSGAVKKSDEPDIRDRLEHHGADGFMAFYSTLPSTKLLKYINSPSHRSTLTHVFDRDLIEHELLDDPRLMSVFEQYLPDSFKGLRTRPHALHLRTEVGAANLPHTVQVDLASLLDHDSDGSLVISDPEIEDIMAACVLAQACRQGNYSILRSVTSLRPVVSAQLARLVSSGRLDATELAKEIEAAVDSFHLRVLLKIAEAAAAPATVIPICHQLLQNGRSHHKRIRASGLVVTPFLVQARRTLTAMPSSVLPTLEDYMARSKELKRWHARDVFKAAFKSIRRRDR